MAQGLMAAHMELMQTTGKIDPQAVARYATVAQGALRNDIGGKVEDLDDMELYDAMLAGASEHMRYQLADRIMSGLGVSSILSLIRIMASKVPRQLHHQLLKDLAEELGL